MFRNMKRGRSLYWEENGQMNTSTMITIGVLSSLIVLSLIVAIIVISHRKVNTISSKIIVPNIAIHQFMMIIHLFMMIMLVIIQATSAANSRKISRSSTNQLIHEALGDDECPVSSFLKRYKPKFC